jgi:hypothetical protein
MVISDIRPPPCLVHWDCQRGPFCMPLGVKSAHGLPAACLPGMKNGAP